MNEPDKSGVYVPPGAIKPGSSRDELRKQVQAVKVALERGTDAPRPVVEEIHQAEPEVLVVPKRRTVALAAANLPPTQTRIFNGVIALFALTICGVVLWGVVKSIASTEPVSPPPVATMDQLSREEPSAAFAQALDDLERAMEGIRGQRPEEILREAAQHDRSCHFEWNNGHPTFFYGQDLPRQNGISLAIEHCAESVRRLHPIDSQ